MYRAVGGFAREYKFTLGEKIKNFCHDLIDLIMAANAREDKLELIKAMDFKLENLGIYVRIAFELRAISPGLFEKLNKHMNDVGVQIGGWQKWAAAQQRK